MNEKESTNTLERGAALFERAAEKSGRDARLSLAVSYVCFITGPMIIVSEQTPDNLYVGGAAIGCGFLFRELKKRFRTEQAEYEEEAANQQELLERLPPEDPTT